MNCIKIDFKLFIILTLTFIFMTVIGTLTHELGHYAMCKCLGYKARINYQSTHCDNNTILKDYSEVYIKYAYKIKKNLNFPGKKSLQKRTEKFLKEDLLITLGGPLQTMITGTIGLMLLWVYRRKVIKSDKVSLAGWLLIFMSLFWLRQVANLFMALLTFITKGQVSGSGDEVKLALYFKINIWSVQIVTALCGLAVLLIILRLLPRRVILTFIISGLTGGILGYYLWLIKFGKYILP